MRKYQIKLMMNCVLALAAIGIAAFDIYLLLFSLSGLGSILNEIMRGEQEVALMNLLKGAGVCLSMFIVPKLIKLHLISASWAFHHMKRPEEDMGIDALELRHFHFGAAGMWLIAVISAFPATQVSLQ